MNTATVVSILTLTFMSGSHGGGQMYAWSNGDPTSTVVRVETSDFITVLSSTTWTRKYSWTGSSLMGKDKPRKISYFMEVLSDSKGQCVTTLRSDHLHTALMEIHTTDCSPDVIEFVAIKCEKEVDFDIERLPFKNVIHFIYVIFKDECLQYSIDSTHNVHFVGRFCTVVEPPRGSAFWTNCYPALISNGPKCTITKELMENSDIDYVKTINLSEDTEKYTYKWVSSAMLVEQKNNADKMKKKTFITYEMERRYYSYGDRISSKLIANDFDNKIVLLEINNNRGLDPSKHVGIKEPSYGGSYVKNGVEKNILIHDITVVLKDMCLRFEITVLNSQIFAKVSTKYDDNVPIGSRIWKELPKGN